MSNEFQKLLSGPIPSISTPFNADGTIDFCRLEHMIDTYIAWGFGVLILTAGDSHYACLSDREIGAVTQKVLQRAGRRAAVIVADRYFATPAALEFAAFAREAGAALYMAMPPDWGHSLTPETLVAHYRAIGRIMPVMAVTNVFIPRGPGFGMEVVRRLLDCPEVPAVKDDMCGAFGREMTMLLGGAKAIVSGGQKQNHFDVHHYGACGYLTTYGRFYPAIARQYQEALARCDYPAATEIIRNFDLPYFKLIAGMTGGFNAGIYGTLELFGLATRHRRKPYTTISDSEMELLRDFFHTHGIGV